MPTDPYRELIDTHVASFPEWKSQLDAYKKNLEVIIKGAIPSIPPDMTFFFNLKHPWGRRKYI